MDNDWEQIAGRKDQGAIPLVTSSKIKINVSDQFHRCSVYDRSLAATTRQWMMACKFHCVCVMAHMYSTGGCVNLYEFIKFVSMGERFHIGISCLFSSRPMIIGGLVSGSLSQNIR
jgi:hypothetical protein